jgi:hypothetical protein
MQDVAVTTTWEPDNKPGFVVQVKVNIPYRPVRPLPPNMMLTSTSRMTVTF